MNNRRPLRRTSYSYTVFLALPLAAGLLTATAHGAAAQILPPPTFAAPPPRPAPQGPLPTGTFLGGAPSGEPTGRVEAVTVVGAIVRELALNLGVASAELALG